MIITFLYLKLERNAFEVKKRNFLKYVCEYFKLLPSSIKIFLGVSARV